MDSRSPVRAPYGKIPRVSPTDPPAPFTPTPRTRVRRKADRGRYDWETVAAVLDAGFVCHVGAVLDDRPTVIPTAYARVDGDLFFHGASGNALLRALTAGAEACVTVTIVDGLVLARSAFHHSINYRSVVLFGRGQAVTDEPTKREAVMAIVDHVVPGRAADSRPPSAEELRATLVVRFPIVEASAKIRSGGPLDDADDLALSHWAGVLPLRTVAGQPVPDEAGPAPTTAPVYVTEWADPGRSGHAGHAGS